MCAGGLEGWNRLKLEPNKIKSELHERIYIFMNSDLNSSRYITPRQIILMTTSAAISQINSFKMKTLRPWRFTSEMGKNIVTYLKYFTSFLLVRRFNRSWQTITLCRPLERSVWNPHAWLKEPERKAAIVFMLLLKYLAQFLASCIKGVWLHLSIQNINK